MPKLAALLLISTLAGCAIVELKPPLCPGTRSYDVQLCRGEKPYMIPNPPYAAFQRKAKCEQCIDIDQNCVWGIPQHCKPKWPFEQR
ncbi:MAG: hypothetical protein EB127_21175 [Alphaproteobacteria bacterium]|nr:hypothetical protein [Alphaproteobacteria bacterium]